MDFLKRDSNSRASDTRLSIKQDEAQKSHICDVLETILNLVDFFQEDHTIIWDKV